jgi:cytoskeletal protein CcmA (bactofilin family)
MSNTPHPKPEDILPDGQTTYIGKSMLIKGEVSGSEPIHVEGRIEGSISLPRNHINVGRHAVVGSDVQAGEVVVRGKLHGKLTVSDRVEIHRTGLLIGDVVTAKISIEEGASFQGSVDMSRPDPKAHQQSEHRNSSDWQSTVGRFDHN